MKKRWLPFFFIATIVLGGCSKDANVDETNEKVDTEKEITVVDDTKKSDAQKEDISVKDNTEATPQEEPDEEKVLYDNYASHNDAYKAIIDCYENREGEDFQYSLVYLDEDDIPELLVDAPGYYISGYSFSEGKLKVLFDTCPYGLGGCVEYEYAPHKNCIRYFSHDSETYGYVYCTLGDQDLAYIVSERYYYDDYAEEKGISYDAAMTDADKALVKSLEGNSFELLQGELKASEM